MPRNPWTDEEDALLIAGMKQHGVRWRLIKRDNPQLDERHPSPCALKDRARVIGSKHPPVDARRFNEKQSRKRPKMEKVQKGEKMEKKDDALTFRCDC